MALESGTYINSLVITNPDRTDKKYDLDDHARLIKSTLKNTFSNVTGPVSATPTEINYISGLTSNLQQQLNAKEAWSSYATGKVTLGPAETYAVTTDITQYKNFYAYPSLGNTQIVRMPYHPDNDISGIFAWISEALSSGSLIFQSNASATVTIVYGIKNMGL